MNLIVYGENAKLCQCPSRIEGDALFPQSQCDSCQAQESRFIIPYLFNSGVQDYFQTIPRPHSKIFFFLPRFWEEVSVGLTPVLFTNVGPLHMFCDIILIISKYNESPRNTQLKNPLLVNHHEWHINCSSDQQDLCYTNDILNVMQI